MSNIFQVKELVFPYEAYRFPGQATDEKILYVTREHKLFLWFRFLFIFLIAAAIFLAAWVFSLAFKSIFATNTLPLLFPVTFLLMGLFILVGLWWVQSLWMRSLAILTNKRLTKFIYTTPFNHYNQSLPLEMIVDTSCNNQGFFAGISNSLLKVGTLTARSSATSSGVSTEDNDRVNKKYFYLENIQYCEDLQQYLNKIISLVRTAPDSLTNFRPFIAHLKGAAREQFIAENYQPPVKEESKLS